MTKVKIISNPYLKEISFQKHNSSGAWSNITIENEPNSQLLSDEIRSGFFPFIVKKITDIIQEEYGDENDSVEIIFEGNGDEYNELKAVCSEDKYQGKITLEKSELFLENARDILPEIRDIYKNVDRLINSPDLVQSEQLRREIQKFLDASSDQIPICVLGNYSTGKSTFINALIGCELLPSGDEPITGRIYKISNTKQKDRAKIAFKEDEGEVEIRFEDTSFRFRKGQMGSELNKEIYDELTSSSEKDLMSKVTKVLEIIEKYVKNHQDNKIDDLLDVEIPFGRGLLNETKNNFVIFDTPGSNSASNIDHVRVLKKAMEDMSNGMPIFVSEYNALDSTDNEKLYKDIKAMNELDSRFTMIIVNKADEADLEEEEGKIGLSESRERRLLNLAIPKNLFGEGVFFVSSIMGLGAKINENFTDKHYLRVFKRSKAEYSNPLDPLYQRLYRYNIMPEQLKRKSIESAESINDNVYANSGLYSVEEEIQTFGDKYSSYNKCFQSELFLRKAIDITYESIQVKKLDREISKQRRIESLEKDKQELVHIIQDTNGKNTELFEEKYPEEINQYVEEMIKLSFEESLEDEKEEYIKHQEEELNISSYVENSENASVAIIDNAKSRFKKAWEEKSFAELLNIGPTMMEDYSTSQQKHEELEMKREKAFHNAEDMILNKKAEDYYVYSLRTIRYLYEQSEKYWDMRSEEIKRILSQIVTGSEALTIERREKLSDIIISYENIEYFVANEDFDMVKFEKDEYLKMIGLWKTDELNLRKLRDSYNKGMKKHINSIYESVRNKFNKSYEKWIEALESTIIENIVEFNPELHSQNEVIKDDTRAIAELESRQKLLTDYKDEIREKMQWKN